MFIWSGRSPLPNSIKRLKSTSGCNKKIVEVIYYQIPSLIIFHKKNHLFNTWLYICVWIITLHTQWNEKKRNRSEKLSLAGNWIKMRGKELTWCMSSQRFLFFANFYCIDLEDLWKKENGWRFCNIMFYDIRTGLLGFFLGWGGWGDWPVKSNYFVPVLVSLTVKFCFQNLSLNVRLSFHFL